jgi:hypothetical protein
VGLLEVRFLALAALLHVAIPVMAGVATSLERPLFVRSSGIFRRSTIEIETLSLPAMERDRPMDRSVPGESEPRPEERPEIDPRRRREVPEGTILEPGPVEPGPVEPGPVEPGAVVVGPSTSEYDTVPEGEPGTGLAPGVGGRPVYTIPGAVAEAPRSAPAPTVAPPARTVPRDIASRVMGEAMRENDRKLGLDFPAGNTVASIVADAIRASSTPHTAKATFEVRLGPGGRLLSVRWLNSTAGTAGEWAQVTSMVTSRLSGREFHMPVAYAAGAIVLIGAVSRLQMPDGSATGGPSLGRDGPPPSSVGGSMSFDVSNLGARPKRIVKASASSRPVQ